MDLGLIILDHNQCKDWKKRLHNKDTKLNTQSFFARATLQTSELDFQKFFKTNIFAAGDIAYPEGNATSPVKKSKRKFRDTRDNFDVRDTFSEPRVGKG